jgi:dTMP kinase
MITELLERGVTVVCDRYAYSGVAYTCATNDHIPILRAIQTDIDLPEPDRVFYLRVPESQIEQREGFGESKYDSIEMMTKTNAIFEKLRDDKWVSIDATRPIDDIASNIADDVDQLIVDTEFSHIGRLWN